MTCMTSFNHFRCNCGNSTFKFPINLLHIRVPLCNLPLEGILQNVCKLGGRDNLVQRCSINPASKWSHRKNWKAAPSPLLYLSLTLSWRHCYRALWMLVHSVLMSYILHLHRLGDGPWLGLSGYTSLASQGET